jgi:hypothetical protein
MSRFLHSSTVKSICVFVFVFVITIPITTVENINSFYFVHKLFFKKVYRNETCSISSSPPLNWNLPSDLSK